MEMTLNEDQQQAMEKSCDTCLFYIDSMPDVIICIGGKHIKEYVNMKHNCKKWVENTPENAKREMERIKKDLTQKKR